VALSPVNCMHHTSKLQLLRTHSLDNLPHLILYPLLLLVIRYYLLHFLLAMTLSKGMVVLLIPQSVSHSGTRPHDVSTTSTAYY
jgi:hypothetical protein